MLLVSSGLLTRSYLQLQSVEPGIDPEGVATFGLSLPAAKYPAPANLDAFVSTLLSRLAAEPGVESAAVACGLPFTSGLNFITGFRHEDQAEPDSASKPSASMRIVSEDYFKTMRIPIRAGRLFDRRDTATAPEVVLINERAAQTYFAGSSPIGQQIRVSAQIARAVPQRSQDHRRHRRQRQVSRPRRGDARRSLSAVRPATGGRVYRGGAHHVGSARPCSLAAAECRWTRSVVAAGEYQVARFTGGRIDRGTSIHHGRVLIVCRRCSDAFSCLASTACSRTWSASGRRKSALRLAIGASPSGIVWLFVREGMVLTAVGLAAGFVGAVAADQWIRTLLFGVTPADPATFAAVGCALTVIAVLATYVPARRAANVDPTDALRTD